MIVQYAAENGIARVTLNRPEKRNALNAEMIACLRKSFDDAAADDRVRVILLGSNGQDFCSGLDLTSMVAADESDVLGHLESARSLAELYLAMRKNPKPIIAAVQGRAMGGGCGLATASDIILATVSAEFRYPEVNLGFVAAIVMAMLVRLVGEKRAFEIVALAESIPAIVAGEMGIVNRVLPEDGFNTQVEEFAAKLASKSASAILLTKDLLYRIDGMTFEAAIHVGLYTNAIARMTPDARTGFKKFAGKK